MRESKAIRDNCAFRSHGLRVWPRSWTIAPYQTRQEFYRVHRLTLGAVEGLAELIEVLNGTVCSPSAGRVGIGERKLASRLLGLVLAPHLGESDEVALRLGVAVNLVVDGFALGGQRVEQGHIGDSQDRRCPRCSRPASVSH